MRNFCIDSDAIIYSQQGQLYRVAIDVTTDAPWLLNILLSIPAVYAITKRVATTLPPKRSKTLHLTITPAQWHCVTVDGCL